MVFLDKDGLRLLVEQLDERIGEKCDTTSSPDIHKFITREELLFLNSNPELIDPMVRYIINEKDIEDDLPIESPTINMSDIENIVTKKFNELIKTIQIPSSSVHKFITEDQLLWLNNNPSEIESGLRYIIV